MTDHDQTLKALTDLVTHTRDDGYSILGQHCAEVVLDAIRAGEVMIPEDCPQIAALRAERDAALARAKLEQAEKHQAPDPYAVPPHVLDTFIVSAGKELGYGTFLLQPENRISSLKAIMGHLIALVRQQNETKAEHDASLMRIKQLEERLQVDPGGSDKIDELEQALKHCRVERDAALQGVAFAESVIGPLKAELAEAKRQNQTFRVAFGAADDAAEHCQKMLLATERERDEAVSLLAKAVALLRAVALGTSYTYMASDKSDRTTVSAVIEDAYAFLNRGKT